MLYRVFSRVFPWVFPFIAFIYSPDQVSGAALFVHAGLIIASCDLYIPSTPTLTRRLVIYVVTVNAKQLGKSDKLELADINIRLSNANTFCKCLNRSFISQNYLSLVPLWYVSTVTQLLHVMNHDKLALEA